jgi:FtsH-binding integral membrane protein
MEPEAPQDNRREAIRQYGLGYGMVFLLTAILAYYLGPPGATNTAEAVATTLGGMLVLLFIPGLFAWLGKTDTPRRRFVLFLALWGILAALFLIGTFMA